MTNKEVGAMQDALKRAKLVAKLVANNYTQPPSPKVIELATKYNDELRATQYALHQLASALYS